MANFQNLLQYKNIITLNQKNIIFAIASLLLIGGVLGSTIFITSEKKRNAAKYNTEYNKEIIAEQDKGIKNLLATGRYKCCLTKPCSYCFSDPDHQDKELVCDCLEDIINGKHPCGECIGEILEGNGNPLISEYFATAIAEEVGSDYLPTLKQIIADKYGVSIDQQL